MNAPDKAEAAKDEIERALDAFQSTFAEAFANAKSEQTLRDENAKVLGKKGTLTAILGKMGALSPDARKSIGARVNAIKAEVEAAFAARLGQIAAEKREAELTARPFDLTLPGRPPASLGHVHPISKVREDVIAIFRGLGFAVFDGPDVDHEENNFTKLGFPPDHPATDMQDSFWTKSRHVLRTHTSNIQVRAMTTVAPPMAFIAPGTVYRRDDDATHSPMFHQLEAFLIDENVSLANLKGILAEFAERMYGPGTPVRLRPSYFPFVEPGAEVDIGCVFCKEPDGTRKGCSLCKHTGWIEILGCGMIHPVVFEHCGIDSKKWTGFALGMGLDRVAMLRYGIPNIKLLFENDPRFLSQF
ncbi:MAG: phenylalanine--tRNA ligase subunit alpha [Myxococcales bacterium]|jgi:phenylalanyl-tRNA synthetase alpha chain|nr:phenylalanine--tRNA ligase subunit alpha [Myxococcales bacterium]